MSRTVTRGTFMRSCRTCGWTGTYSTAAMADRSKRQHSCAKAIARAQAKARGDARRASVDRTPKPCLHKQANHQHGTNAAYTLDRCRCELCSAGHAAATMTRVRAKAYGRYDRYVDAEPVRAHVRDLMAAGVGLKRIVKLTGASQGTLWKLVYGKRQPDGTQVVSKRVLRETAEKLQRLTPADAGRALAGGALDPHGTTRARTHLRALVALGWSMSKLGERLGFTYVTNFIPVVTDDQRVMVHSTVLRTEALYAELSMTLPPAETRRDRIAVSRARNYAKARGWLPPLALDDDHDGDLELTPPGLDEQAIWRRMHGDRTVRLTKDESAELARRWVASGRPLAEMERITGLNSGRYRALEEAS